MAREQAGPIHETERSATAWDGTVATIESRKKPGRKTREYTLVVVAPNGEIGAVGGTYNQVLERFHDEIQRHGGYRENPERMRRLLNPW